MTKSNFNRPCPFSVKKNFKIEPFILPTAFIVGDYYLLRGTKQKRKTVNHYSTFSRVRVCVSVWTGRDLYAKFSIRSEHNVATHHVWQMVARYRSIRRWTGGNHVSYASCARSEADCLALAAIRLNWTRTTTFYSLAVTILRFSTTTNKNTKIQGLNNEHENCFIFSLPLFLHAKM